jgi:hypothetical protein
VQSVQLGELGAEQIQLHRESAQLVHSLSAFVEIHET